MSLTQSKHTHTATITGHQFTPGPSPNYVERSASMPPQRATRNTSSGPVFDHHVQSHHHITVLPRDRSKPTRVRTSARRLDPCSRVHAAVENAAAELLQSGLAGGKPVRHDATRRADHGPKKRLLLPPRGRQAAGGATRRSGDELVAAAGQPVHPHLSTCLTLGGH